MPRARAAARARTRALARAREPLFQGSGYGPIQTTSSMTLFLDLLFGTAYLKASGRELSEAYGKNAAKPRECHQ